MVSENFPIIAIDTETDSNIPFIATSTDQQLKTTLYDLNKPKDYSALKKICESPNIIKVMHPVTYDGYCVSLKGIKIVPPYECTLAAASLVNEYLASRKLKAMARNLLNEKCEEDSLLKKVKAKFRRVAKKEGKKFVYSMIPSEVLYPYAKQDSVYTIKLWYLFKKPLQKYIKLYELEKNLIPIIIRMQQRGFLIDRSFVKRKMKYCSKQLLKLGKSIIAYLKRKKIKNINIGKLSQTIDNFNPESPKQVSSIIETLEIPVKGLTKRGDFSTDSGTLKKHKKNPFVRDILANRFYSKQLNTYYDSLYNEYTSEDDPIAHFLFWQSGTRTGRFSADLIQTIPKIGEDEEGVEKREVRKAFIPRPGCVYIAMDQNQVEMRIFAHASKAKRFIDAIKKGFDPHLDTAYNIWGEQIVNRNKKFYRRQAKILNFSIIYGMGKNLLMEQLNIDIREATEILQAYYSKYPVKEFMQSEIRKLYKRGYVTIRYNSSLMNFSRDYRVPTNLAYKAVNVIVQGTCAYITKYSMIRAAKLIDWNKWGIHLLLALHDELLFEVPKSLFKTSVINAIKNELEDKITFRVPITVDVKWSDRSWGDMKDWREQNA